MFLIVDSGKSYKKCKKKADYIVKCFVLLAHYRNTQFITNTVISF